MNDNSVLEVESGDDRRGSGRLIAFRIAWRLADLRDRGPVCLARCAAERHERVKGLPVPVVGDPRLNSHKRRPCFLDRSQHRAWRRGEHRTRPGNLSGAGLGPRMCAGGNYAYSCNRKASDPNGQEAVMASSTHWISPLLGRASDPCEAVRGGWNCGFHEAGRPPKTVVATIVHPLRAYGGGPGLRVTGETRLLALGLKRASAEHRSQKR